MAATLINLSNLGIHSVNALISPVLAHPITSGVVAATAVATAITGRRLAIFMRPEWPRRSAVARQVGQAVAAMGNLALRAVSGYTVIVSGLTVGSYVFAAIARPEQYVSLFDAGLKGLAALGDVAGDTLADTGLGIAVGVSLGLVTNIWLIPKIERGGQCLAATDALARLRKSKQYNSRRYFGIAKGCFVGLDGRKNPIYVPWAKIRETHIQIVGATGSGKGVVLGLMATQCLLAGESVVWIDPKNDRFASRILHDVAKETGRQFHFVDLRAGQPPQFSLFAGCREAEIIDLLVAGFELQNSGTDGDFHRGRDRDAAAMVAKIAIQKNIKSVLELFAACAGEKEITEQENFWRRFRELASMMALHTRDGFDLSRTVENGGVVFIVGSCESESTKMLQRMVLLRILQIAKDRDRTRKNRHVCLILDEFKHLISPVTLTTLGVIRDFDVHCLLAHQSLGDLADCPGLSTAAVHGAVVDNTAIKVIYKLSDADYAEKLAKLSGHRRKFTETVTKSPKSDTGASHLGTWVESDDFFIPPEVITQLPMPSDRLGQPSVGVLFGVGDAQLFAASPIPTDPTTPLPPLVEAVPISHVNKLLGGEGVI